MKEESHSSLENAALLIIDMQNDFMPWGSLPVPEADKIIPIINKLIPKFTHVIATKDWHPSDHVSFALNHAKHPGEIIHIEGGENQELWPIHCVADTLGANFVYQIDKEKIERFFLKGTDPQIDSYSAFFDRKKKKATELESYLQEKKIDTLFITGVAVQYCVKYTVFDALSLHYNVYVVVDACKGVKHKSYPSEIAFEEMEERGAILLNSEKVMAK